MAAVERMRRIMTLLLVTSVLSLTFLFLGVSTAETSWDRQDVTVKQGDNITLVCTVKEAEPNDVVRIFYVQSEARTKATIADNSYVKAAFSKLTRLKVTYEGQVRKEDSAKQLVLTLSFTGIRGEDSGKIGCYALSDEHDIDYVELTVNVPMESVELLTSSANTSEERSVVFTAGPRGTNDGAVVGGEILLVEGVESSVSCLAKISGSLTPPRIKQMRIGWQTVTNLFTVVNRHQILNQVNSEDVGEYKSETRAWFNTSTPSFEYNGREIECTASTPGYYDVIVESKITVHYAPIISCYLPLDKNGKYAVTANGKSCLLECLVKVNPRPTWTWHRISDLDILEPVDENTTVATQHLLERGYWKDLNGTDHIKLHLFIKELKGFHFTSYVLTVTNYVGARNTTIMVRGFDPASSVQVNDREVSSRAHRDQERLQDPAKSLNNAGCWIRLNSISLVTIVIMQLISTYKT